jgi:hypothetical protein
MVGVTCRIATALRPASRTREQRQTEAEASKYGSPCPPAAAHARCAPGRTSMKMASGVRRASRRKPESRSSSSPRSTSLRETAGGGLDAPGRHAFDG